MNKYTELKKSLEDTGSGKMRVYGQSMTPLIESGSLLTYEVKETYSVGDIVLSKVKGRWIDAHKITGTKLIKGGITQYCIANNHGHTNGWTTKVFGKVVSIEKGPPEPKKDNNKESK